MIAKMKKLRILALSSRKEHVTAQLRELGTVHIRSSQATTANLENLNKQKRLLETALAVLDENHLDENNRETIEGVSLETALAYAHEIHENQQKVAETADAKTQLQREINRLRDWGDFSPGDFDGLAEAGIELYPAEITRNQLGDIPQDQDYILLGKEKKRLKIVFLGKPELATVELLQLPKASLSEFKDQLNQLYQQEKKLTAELNRLAEQGNYLHTALLALGKDLEFADVEANLLELEDMAELCQIEGYFPADKSTELGDFASQAGVGMVIQNPGEEDTVPTLTRNPRAVNIVKPIFSFMGTTPGYREQDISFWFLIFFTLFFAMIIGDAGYGAILGIIAVGITLRSKIQNGVVHDGILLFDLLALGTVVWGAVTGNWFGYGAIADIPFLARFVIPGLDSFEVEKSAEVTQTIQYICFVIAIVHLLLAHLLSFIKKIREAPRIHGFADPGWIAVICGLFFLVLNVVISVEKYPVPDFALYLMAGGIAVVFIFANQQGDGFFKGILRSLNPGEIINTLLSGISAFADVISYIRLFAVGLASVEIAKSFNSMAEGIMANNGPGGIVAGVFVLALGHTLNLAMGGLSVIVHGIRLKMLEFSSHLGNEWVGFEYRPFKNETL